MLRIYLYNTYICEILISQSHITVGIFLLTYVNSPMMAVLAETCCSYDKLFCLHWTYCTSDYSKHNGDELS
jgi:hypothetical protein